MLWRSIFLTSRTASAVISLLMLLVGTSMPASESSYSKIVLVHGTYSAELIGNPDLSPSVTVRTVASDKGFDVATNGGYFDNDNRPSGYLKIGGSVIQDHVSDRLSGVLVFNAGGDVQVRPIKDIDVSTWENVEQNGPLVVDPGGRPGIRADDGRQARRVCIGTYSNGDVLILLSKPVSLYVLAKAIVEQEPGIDVVLNLDGGPMAGVWSRSDQNLQHANISASISYLGITLKPGQ